MNPSRLWLPVIVTTLMAWPLPLGAQTSATDATKDLSKELASSWQELEGLRKKVLDQAEELKVARERLAVLREANQRLTTSQAELRGEIAALKVESRTAERRDLSLDERDVFERLKMDFAARVLEVEQARGERERLKAQNAALQARVEDTEKAKTTLTARYEILQQDYERLRVEVRSLTTEAERRLAADEELARSHEARRQRIQELETKLAGLTEEMQHTAMVERNALQAKVAALEQELADKQSAWQRQEAEAAERLGNLEKALAAAVPTPAPEEPNDRMAELARELEQRQQRVAALGRHLAEVQATPLPAPTAPEVAALTRERDQKIEELMARNERLQVAALASEAHLRRSEVAEEERDALRQRLERLQAEQMNQAAALDRRLFEEQRGLRQELVGLRKALAQERFTALLQQASLHDQRAWLVVQKLRHGYGPVNPREVEQVALPMKVETANAAP